MAFAKQTGTHRGETPTGFDYNDGDVTVHECPDGGFCCGENNSTCCGTSEAKYIVNGQVTNINPNATSSVSSSSTTTSSGTSSSSSTTATPIPGQPNSQDNSISPNPQTDNGGGTNVGAIAGGVVGGVVALALVGAALWYMRRRERKGPGEQRQPHAQDSYFPPPKPSAPRYFVQPGLHEAEGIVNGRNTSQLDSSEKYEIGGHQKKDRMANQELE
ncbi:MAG: hypothetical protein Q9209_006690 [Squamulea sp. 1 TL-2023]